MRVRLVATALGGAFLLLGLTGCNSGASGPPSVNSPSGSQSSASSTTPASQIANPLSLSTFATNTCAGLTDAQLAPYMGSVAKTNQQQVDDGPLCGFFSTNISNPNVSVSVANISTPTQELLYESVSQFPWRQKIGPISGYPAVNASPDGNGQDDCLTNVAVNTKQSIEVHFSDPNASGQYYSTPCIPSEALAALLIQNIQLGKA